MASRHLWLSAAALTALYGCSTEEGGGNLLPGSGGNGQGGGVTNASSGPTTTSSAIASTSTGMGGSSPYVCDPPAAPGSIYEREGTPFYPPFDKISMCQFRGDVMLIVNTAAL
jgi:glutathione peroxidase